MRSLSLLVLVFAFANPVLAQNPPSQGTTGGSEKAPPAPDRTGDDLIETYNKMKASVISMQASNSCGYDFAGSKDKLCDFKSVCDKLNGYGTEGVLYQAKDGKTIPNYALQGAEDAIKGCLSQRNVQLNLSKKSSKEMMGSMFGGEAFQKHLEKVNQAGKRFLESVLANNEGDTKTAVELASLNQIISASDKAKSKDKNQSTDKAEEDQFKPPPNREDYSKMLENLETEAGKKFSEKTRNLYLDFMVESADTSYYNAEDAKSDPIKVAMNEVG